MVLNYLDRYLPVELSDKIYRMVHDEYMADLLNEIKYNVVWIKCPDGSCSFLVGKTSNNPYYVLRSDIPAHYKGKGYSIESHINYNYMRHN